MPTLNTISADKLARLIGTPNCPAIVDVRTGLAPEARAIPAARFRNVEQLSEWSPALVEGEAIVICDNGTDASPGVAALLRHAGCDARILEGGFADWQRKNLPTYAVAKVPRRDLGSASLWVTRSRPKVDRIACPWLIRRFVDPEAVILFVAPTDVPQVAERFGAEPFDVDGVFWSHRGESCSFDTMLEEFGLGSIEALARLATIVRGADTGRPELAPQAAGLVAVSLGLSRMFSDDLEQLEAGMTIYDALFRWCRDATDETHDWVSHQPKRTRGALA